ncbi:xanthine dehydrogenase family protein molybdopterin-binding subunit [Anaerosphaera multitolerans]|uniref:Aldehyde oxidase n=1 Tax=Anaerosphaera multitolerans TaxID=2487351 RepID=A0A437S5C2_9FIRM|nr:molybdopterin cofactor-binding domain-containing protein [Anaerosphaera multitolerans]RVU54106.1 aldehyde oxidase [Anaerosphaera multitolerans]
MKYIGKSIKKVDSTSILQGRKVYTDDLADDNALIIKLLRSPHPHALIKSIDTSRALKVEGVECILTYEDVPKTRFTLAGQSYPEPSPYDRLILDRELRYVGDPVAIIAAENEKAAEKAKKLIKVEYELLDFVIDFEKAEEGPMVHSERPFNHLPKNVILSDYDKNIVGQHNLNFGSENIDEVYDKSPVKIDSTYYTQAQAQSMMETFRSYSYMDSFNRLVVVSSTQVPFHIKRQLAQALEISPSRIRVIKPRIGGAFGAKQTSETEIYPALVTLKTKKSAKIVYSRKETYYASNSRHATKVRVKVGAEKDGTINSIDIDALSDQGAYGTHAWTTLKLIGEKTLPLYNSVKASRFKGKTVYTNKMPGGAFRGYGATQGAFAVESAINELAAKLKMDPVDLRLKNLTTQGDITTSFNKDIRSSRLDECILRGKELIDWDNIYPGVKISQDKVLSVGTAITMQGSGIEKIDTSTAQIKLNESGDYTLFVSCTDAGTGTDTIMVQMAAEILKTDIENITLIVADTDLTPFDPGSYASSGAYTTGNAVVRAANKMVERLKLKASKILKVDVNSIDFDGMNFSAKEENLPLNTLSEKLTTGEEGHTVIETGHFGNDDSPPPFMAGFCQLETDLLTGEAKVVKYVGVVDCGTVVNENLARIQVESGIVQGIGYALYEDVQYDSKGKVTTDSFMKYNIPTRLDIGELKVEFKESFEPTGPFGAKSIGEVVINTSAPAIANAIYNGINKNFRKLPIKPEDILLSLD